LFALLFPLSLVEAFRQLAGTVLQAAIQKLRDEAPLLPKKMFLYSKKNPSRFLRIKKQKIHKIMLI
jgi:hypothetical protein